MHPLLVSSLDNYTNLNIMVGRPSVQNRVDYKISRPSCSPGTKCLSFCSGAWNLRATWGEGAAVAVKPLSPPGGERLVVAGVLKCAA